MPPTYFPLRWESTGDQWWYASPIDYAAANGHYDLVRELLKIDSNHLMKLTSLRRIRRLETVWDDESQLHDVAKSRSQVARKLYVACNTRNGKNTLIRAGYGGWLMYTAASAGDLSFVQDLLERNPLLVFGEGEYGVTDILYAAARSRNTELFRLVYDFAVSPRFLSAKNGVLMEEIGEVPEVYRWEMKNRALHAASRGGNLKSLKEILGDCSDDEVLGYRDKQGSTLLHAAAGKGQVQVVEELAASFDIINSTDNQGNTALHIAAYRGQAAAADALITASPSLINVENSAGETFLHMAVSGFQTPAFERLDRHRELMNHLLRTKKFDMGKIINCRNSQGQTPLHIAISGNIHLEFVEMLMSTKSIDVNIRDADDMTPLDLLRQRPPSASSDLLIRRLISAGGMFSCQDHDARRAIASHLKMHGNISSPGTSFRISDAEIFLYTGLEIVSDTMAGPDNEKTSPCSMEICQLDSTDANQLSSVHKKSRNSSVNSAAERLKSVFLWPRTKEIKKNPGKPDNSAEESNPCTAESTQETLVPLRQRFSRPSSPPNNKRALSVRSNQSGPTTKKKRFGSGIVQGVIQAMPNLSASGRSSSSSFSRSSINSSSSVSFDLKQKGVFVDSNIPGPSCSKDEHDNRKEKGNFMGKQGSVNKRSRSRYFCFGASGLSVKTPVSRNRENPSIGSSVISVA